MRYVQYALVVLRSHPIHSGTSGSSHDRLANRSGAQNLLEEGVVAVIGERVSPLQEDRKIAGVARLVYRYGTCSQTTLEAIR